MANDGTKVAPGLLPASFPRGMALLQNPTLNKGTAFTEAERDAAGTDRAASAAREHAGAAARARAGELPPEARRPRALHQPGGAARPQRDAVLPDGRRPPRRDDARHLHADRRPRVPAVRPHLPAAARALHQRQGPRPRRGRSCATGRTARSRSSSSRTASASSGWATWARTAWASRSASSRSTRPAQGCRRPSACRCCSTWAPTTRRCGATRCTSGSTSRACPSTCTTAWSRSSSRRRRRCFPAWSCSSRTSRTTTRSGCSSATATGSRRSTTTSRARRPSRCRVCCPRCA